MYVVTLIVSDCGSAQLRNITFHATLEQLQVAIDNNVKMLCNAGIWLQDFVCKLKEAAKSIERFCI